VRDQERFGRNLDTVLSAESRTTFTTQAIPTAIKRGFWRGEVLVRTDSEADLPMSAVLIAHRASDGSVSHLSTIMRDISVEKEQARLLERAKEMVEEASTLRSELLANLSHEIRTPMNGVMGMTELLLQSSSPLTEEQRDYLMTIRESSESLLVVISDLLDYGKVEAGEFHAKLGWFSLSEIIDGLRKLFVVRFKEKQLSFTPVISADVPDVVMSDAHRLRQMLINLIGNAVIFSPKGGTITLDVSLESRVGKTAVVTLAVSDQGAGIAEEQLRSVTEAFVEGKSLDWRKLGGVSVGIGICAKLIRLMEGDIRVESEPGSGSRFSVTIPLTIGSHRDLEAFAKSKNQLEEASERPMLPFKILLVEDNPVNQKLARLLLEKLGHSVVLADDGDVGVEKYLSDHFDLVLMDVQMPRLDGYAATGKIRDHEATSKAPRTPIVAMTAQALEGDRERCIDAGMDDYVSKPISKAHLTRILQELSESMQRRRG
jgi:signal transduction histidine kinase/ActR/RegA family two-component response regulator